MNEEIDIMRLLKRLFDLDNLIADKEADKKIGFRIDEEVGLLSLKRERSGLLKQIPKEYAEVYERIRKRYPLAIAEVKNGFCFGCFQQLPTEMLTKSNEIVTCPNCGRILFWREE
ncbi:MAG: zinc ribbon domain-containing protein [bacterium]